jgi:alkylated DNA nucleotide flippase Atl1
MGYREMDKVWECSQATKLDKFVLLAIAKTYNKGKGSYPSQSKLAKMTGIADARGVRRSLQRLTVLGELVWVRGSNNSGKSNVYFISFIEQDIAKLTAIADTKMTAVNDQNDRLTSDQIDPLLNKRLNKLLDRESRLVFSSVPGSPFWDVVAQARPDLSFVERKEFLESFGDTWIAKNAYTDAKLVDACLAYLPSTKGNDV